MPRGEDPCDLANVLGRPYRGDVDVMSDHYILTIAMNVKLDEQWFTSSMNTAGYTSLKILHLLM